MNVWLAALAYTRVLRVNACTAIFDVALPTNLFFGLLSVPV